MIMRLLGVKSLGHYLPVWVAKTYFVLLYYLLILVSQCVDIKDFSQRDDGFQSSYIYVYDSQQTFTIASVGCCLSNCEQKARGEHP